MKVEPITDVKQIKSLKKILADQPRDLLLFVLSINSGIRVGDVLRFKAADLRGKSIGDRISIKESKTNKMNIIVINSEIKYALDNYFNVVMPKDDDYIFKSRKGKNYPLTVHRVTMLVKSWGKLLNIKSNLGAHTLRKTFCYIQRTVHGTSWEVLSLRMNHSTPSITRRYLGVSKEEVEKALMNNI
ncbi:site-specific integrase [Fundidesulfovibrio butyratiphilus]